MKTQPARNRVEVDLLPPFGKPEVVAFGPVSKVVALFAMLLIGAQLFE